MFSLFRARSNKMPFSRRSSKANERFQKKKSVSNRSRTSAKRFCSYKNQQEIWANAHETRDSL